MEEEEIKKGASTTMNHCSQKNLHTLQSVRFNNQRTEHSGKRSILDT